jgi:hypothetical protein
MLEADGKETIEGTSQRDTTGYQSVLAKQDGTIASSSSKGSEEVFIGYVALFGEIHLFDTGLRIGASYVPYALESETTDNNRSDNCSRDYSDGKEEGTNVCTITKQTVQIDVEDLTTVYAAYHHDVDLGLLDSVFVKGGIIEGDIITKEKLSSGSKYPNATLEGSFIGLGAEKNLDNGLFVRLEAGMTKYQGIKLTNGQTADEHENFNTIEITGLDGATATISIGKTF